jgi:hypothetical protein
MMEVVSASPGGERRWAHLKQKGEEEKETRKSRSIEEVNRKDENERKKDKSKDTQGISNSTDAVEGRKGLPGVSLVGSPPSWSIG